MAKQATIIDVARHAGVSIKTVSRVVNNEPHVQDHTRGKVLAAIQRLGYSPNAIAREMVTQATRVVAFVFATRERMFCRETYFTEIFDSAQRELLERNYFTLFLAPGNAPADPLAYAFDLVRQRKVSGVILADLTGGAPPDPAAQTTPIVHLTRPLRGKKAASVFPDNEGGMEQVVGCLAELGHRRIGFLGRMPGRHSAETRLRGFEKAMRRRGLAVDPGLIVDVLENTPEAGAAAVSKFVSAAKTLPTALCGFTDIMGLTALAELQRLGLRVPHDISVTGFDDIDMCSLSVPGLTTVQVRRDEIGRVAARKLIAMIEGAQDGDSTLVQTRLVARGSTAPPRPAAARPRRNAAACLP
ncbi:MAG TPA: LacI family DNA-binding transcriptional regulator [Candidatus Brocadiia bacterium]|nr:LacI family DNA-binding transcriptional regulator [Candidatus Brocadiia bacterium]